MKQETFWGLVSIVLATIQYVPYFRGIFSGRVKPHAFTWLVWALPTGITFFAQMQRGGGAGAWVMGYTAVLCAAVFVVSIKRGEKNIVPLDWATLLCALLAIALWIVTKDPLTAVIISVIAASLGWIPTIRKSIHDPYGESVTSYAVSLLKWAIAIVALQSWNWTTLLYPLVSILSSGAFVAMVLEMRRAHARLKSGN